ncbi:MAG: OmpA family protein [Planctomycetes bacterium]|nr:OmpA family protein [Planctomycetota bacterium]
MAEEPSSGGGVPEWVVTFGDMMSLLLTFFIMLVSLSEVKQDERFQAMVESFRKRFGHDLSQMSMTPGDFKPRNSSFDALAVMGRAQKLDTHNGGDKVQAPVGDHPQVRIVRPGSRTTIGTVIYFREEELALTEDQKQVLRDQAPLLLGKPQKIEIRGHTSLRPVAPGKEYSDNWDLAYQRARSVRDFLVNELEIEPNRLRLTAAGASEPVEIGADPIKLEQNPRVELFLLDETVDDFFGSRDQFQERFSQ